MSQIQYKKVVKDRHREFVTGWDRPLQHFFLNVYPDPQCCGECEKDDPTYTSLGDPEAEFGGGLSLEQVADKLHEFGLSKWEVDTLCALLDHHRDRDAGNVVIHLGNVSGVE